MRVPLPPTPPVFESSVLASRFISCSRKSSFLPTSPPGGEKLAEVPDVGGHARQLLGDIAALHQHGNFLEQPLAVELRASSRFKPLREPLLVALLDLRPQRGHAFGGLGQPVERCVQNRLQRLAFSRAHDLQLFEQRRNLFEHAIGECGEFFVAAIVNLQSAGHAQNRVQIRLAGGDFEFVARRCKGCNVAGHQFAIVAGFRLGCAVWSID